MNRILCCYGAILMGSIAMHATPVCSVSTSGIAFGSYNSLSGQSATSSGTISVTCTGNPGDSATYTITIAAGAGSYSTRTMAAGAHSLVYNLYKDSGCTQVWGDNSNGTYSVTDSITLSSSSDTKNYVVYGRIAGSQNSAAAGSYSDNLLITITY